MLDSPLALTATGAHPPAVMLPKRMTAMPKWQSRPQYPLGGSVSGDDSEWHDRYDDPNDVVSAEDPVIEQQHEADVNQSVSVDEVSLVNEVDAPSPEDRPDEESFTEQLGRSNAQMTALALQLQAKICMNIDNVSLL